MKNIYLTPKDISQFSDLVAKLRQQNYWLPERAFELMHRAMSWWAAEIVIMRKGGKEVLLTLYTGKYFKGQWHIPGGFSIRDESLEQHVDRISRREIGQSVKFKKVLSTYKWKANEHPIGRPLSVFCLCQPAKKIIETDEMKWFPIKKLPSTMIGCQKRFLQTLK
ncbi:MAG: NUDIX domain-containing protein [bacterium]